MTNPIPEERAEALRLAAEVRTLAEHGYSLSDYGIFRPAPSSPSNPSGAELAREARAVILTYGTPQFADMLCALDEVLSLSKLAEESSGD